jgi:DNA-binding MarR family transcriptional regulator
LLAPRNYTCDTVPVNTGRLTERRRALTGVEEAFAAFASGTGPARLHQKIASAAGRAIDPSGFPMLRWIETSGPVRITALAAQAGLDASTVSRRVSDLEEKGLVSRATDRDDQRASLLEMTPEGRRVLAALRDARRHLLEEALAEWPTEEIVTLGNLLERFAATLTAAI